MSGNGMRRKRLGADGPIVRLLYDLLKRPQKPGIFRGLEWWS